MDDKIERLQEIIRLANKLNWIHPSNNTSYPLMHLSEVEKCMLAMVDDVELRRMRNWVEYWQEATTSYTKMDSCTLKRS